jgi:lipoate-protein ligase A
MDDFTYSVVLPPSYPLPPDLLARYRRISGGIIRALGKLGLEARVGDDPGGAYRAMTACFASGNAADLKVNGRKICGSAQLARKGAVLQHGTLYLEDNSWLFHRLLRHGSTEERELVLRDYRNACTTLGEALGKPPSWAELEKSFALGFEEELELKVMESSLTPKEEIIWKRLVKSYRSHDWLYHRKGEEEPEPEGIPPGQVKLAGDSKVPPTPSALPLPSCPD